MAGQSLIEKMPKPKTMAIIAPAGAPKMPMSKERRHVPQSLHAQPHCCAQPLMHAQQSLHPLFRKYRHMAVVPVNCFC
jgi:hypothetical protein